MIMKDKAMARERARTRYGKPDDGLGPTSDIGSKLRALYGAIQDEGIPDKLLDLLEKLDKAEESASTTQPRE